MPQNRIQFQHGMSLNEFIERYGTEGAVRAGAGAGALAGRLRLSRVRRARALPIPRRRAPRTGSARPAAPSSTVMLRHPVSCLQAAADHVVPGDLPGHAEQEQHLRPVAQAPSRRCLHHRLAGQAQAARGDAPARVPPPARTGWCSPTTPCSAACRPANPGVAPRTRRRSWPRSSSTTTAIRSTCASTRSPTTRARPSPPGRSRHCIPRAHLVTDGCASFNAAGAQVAAHGAIIVGNRKSSELEPFRWVNTFISNAKTAISGTYHHFDFDKYRHRYLAEAQYRVNRRFDLASLVGRLVHTCARTAPCPERWLRLAEIGRS